ncbi:MAG: site-specific integrase [Candidatus Methanoperedens sp.]|nr:site-specific integrase [Candidatus Methanoperedens sp.]MCE8429018.1 site-specific integrase [Candidatus Methanoperedens sp.]
MSAIKSFYTVFEIDLPKSIKNGDTKPSPENMNSDFGLETIKRMLMYCSNIRDRAIILTMKSSGLARQEIINLTYKQFRTGYNKDDKITTIRMVRAKVEVEFITFIDPEGSEAIREYLRKKGRLTINGDFDSRFDNSSLFLSHRKPVRGIYRETFTEIFRYLSIKMDCHTPVKMGTKYHYNPNRSHNLRKFFNTQLKNSKIGDDRVETMMGHTADKTKSTYYLQNVQELRTLYKEHMHVLAIYADRINESDILEKNRKLTAEVERLKLEDTPERAFMDFLKDESKVRLLFEKFKKFDGEK